MTETRLVGQYGCVCNESMSQEDRCEDCENVGNGDTLEPQLRYC